MAILLVYSLATISTVGLSDRNVAKRESTAETSSPSLTSEHDVNPLSSFLLPQPTGINGLSHIRHRKWFPLHLIAHDGRNL